MTPPLYAHQQHDVDFILNNPLVFNASDPGTGKTRTCIESIRQLKCKALILAPKSILRAAWEADFRKFAPELTVSVAFASNRDNAFKADADVYITNIDAVTWLIQHEHHLKRFDADSLLVIDESTAYKHHTTQRSKAMQKIAQRFDRRILMSGTPSPNGVLDFWGQMFILDGGARLGKSYYSFRHTACTPVQNGPGAAHIKWIDRPGIEDAVYDLISDLCIRHKLEDVIDMPEHVITPLQIGLSPKIAAAYQQLQQESWLELESSVVTALNAATRVQKLLQCLSGSVYDEHGVASLIDTERYELVLDLVEARAQCVVAFIWTHQRDKLICEAMKRKIPFGVIDGSVSDRRRLEIVEQFQAGQLRVVFAHPQSAGHGLTLTRGTTTIWASPTYNAEHYKQFNHRIYRSGQTQRTETILISAAGTHEDKVYTALTDKLDSMNTLLTLIGGKP